MKNLERDREIKIEHFHNLIAVALADGKLNEEEIDFFTEKGQEFGLTYEEVDSIIQKADQLQFMVPMNKIDCEEQLSDAVFMAMIDGEIHEKEYQLCVNLAEKLDLSQKDVDHIVSLAKKLWKLGEDD